MMHKPFIASIVLAVSLLYFNPASAAECNAAGTFAPWGENSLGAFTIPAGGTCLFSLRIPGVVNSSSISKQPAHGKLRRLNVSSYEYRATPGYRGADTFAVTATGKTAAGASGTSTVTLNAMIQ